MFQEPFGFVMKFVFVIFLFVCYFDEKHILGSFERISFLFYKMHLCHIKQEIFLLLLNYFNLLLFLLRKKKRTSKKRGVSLRVCIVQFVLKQFCKTSQLSQPFLKKKKKTLVSLVDLGG